MLAKMLKSIYVSLPCVKQIACQNTFKIRKGLWALRLRDQSNSTVRRCPSKAPKFCYFIGLNVKRWLEDRSGNNFLQCPVFTAKDCDWEIAQSFHNRYLNRVSLPEGSHGNFRKNVL